MRPLPEAGAKLEPQLWGTQTEAQNEPQLGGGLPGVKLNGRISARVEGDN